MQISKTHADAVLAKCARHCCICRRFRPTQLHVHHIVKQGAGGSNELDNLTAICVSCHSDVHSNTEITRRFTFNELKLHRDNVYRLVEQGKLPANLGGTDDLIALSAAVIEMLKSKTEGHNDSGPQLLIESLDILLTAVAQQSRVNINRSEHGVYVQVGNNYWVQHKDLPSSALYPDSIIKLVSANLLEGNSDELYVTQSGYAFSDDLISTSPHYTMVKAQCFSCHLHFVVCTWYPERHARETLHCPECGQHDGNFIMWYQRMFGFIFETVPGRGQSVAGATTPIKLKTEQ